MKFIVAVFALFLLYPRLGAQQAQRKETVAFVWRDGKSVIGTFELPRGFMEETKDYRDGLDTRLCYSDGACFVFQRGFPHRIPRFKDPEHIVDFSQELSDRIIRRGHYKGKSDVLGEVDYKPRRYHPPLNGIIEEVMPNLGYEHVPGKRQSEFVTALESFKLSQ